MPVAGTRPLLEPNLSAGGMFFWCTCLFVFLAANVIVGKKETLQLDTRGAASASDLLKMKPVDQEPTGPSQWQPGNALVHARKRQDEAAGA